MADFPAARILLNPVRRRGFDADSDGTGAGVDTGIVAGVLAAIRDFAMAENLLTAGLAVNAALPGIFGMSTAGVA